MLGPMQQLTIILSLCPCLLLCDVMELKTGERLEGTFKQANAAGVVILVGGQTVTMPLVKVRAIYFGAAPVAQQPTVTKADPSAAHEALKALKALRAATEVGMLYPDYRARLADTKVKVGEYLDSAEAQDSKNIDFNGPVKLAMQDYEQAAKDWSVKMTTGMATDELVAKSFKDAAAKITEAEQQLNEVPSIMKLK